MSFKLNDVKRYLIHLAVSKFNDMYGTNHQVEEFDIISIEHQQYKYSFEVFTFRDDDNLRLRMYLGEGPVTLLNKYNVLEQNNGWEGSGDNVFVTYGILGDDFFTYNCNSTRRSIVIKPSNLDIMAIVLCENGDPLLLEENGGYLHLEISTAGGLYP